MKINIKSIKEMLSLLRSNSNVLGLIEYGSAQESDVSIRGDYDLFVVLNSKVESVESLHFFIGNTPVDLNIRSLQEIQEASYLTDFNTALLDGRVIYDPSRTVTRALHELKDRQRKHGPQVPSAQSIAFTRHGHRHIFDKARNYIKTKPLLVKLLLHTNIHWLLENYFKVRGLQYRGEKCALEYLQENEQEIYQGIEHFYSTNDFLEQIEIEEELTALILKPVGGKWATGEILAFGDTKTQDLQRNGQEVFNSLFRTHR